MEKGTPITTLADGIVKEMERLNYAAETIRIFRLDCRKFLDYVLPKDPHGIFTEEIGLNYLLEKYGHSESGFEKHTLEGVRAVRCVRRLGEYDLYGGFSSVQLKRIPPVKQWAADDENLINAYIGNANTADNKPSTKEARETHLRNFYSFLGIRGVSSVKNATASIISDYVLSMSGYAPQTVQHRVSTLRNYLHFLYNNGYSECDLSHSVPIVKRPKNINIPALWEEDKVVAMLNSIDRGSPTGRRDYAILLIAVQLGLRRSDISHLRFEHLHWERKEIDLVQQKTNTRVVLPLFDDVGWAIIDYIRYGRPQSEEPFVFLARNAPYRKMEAHTVGDVVRRAMDAAGYGRKVQITSGMHSLRHALARRLLKQGSPLSEVADILGHANFHSTPPYLRVDIDGLRDCCLPIEGVTTDA